MSLHWADAMSYRLFFLIQTSVVLDLILVRPCLVITPVRMAESPNCRACALLKVVEVPVGFCLPARGPCFFQIPPLPSALTRMRFGISSLSMVAPSPLSNALNHWLCRRSSSLWRLFEEFCAKQDVEVTTVATIMIAKSCFMFSFLIS